MRTLTEKEAEEFLKKEGFEIIDTIFVKSEDGLKKSWGKLSLPVVMKVSSKKIVHKTKVNGVILNIKDYDKAVEVFKRLMKIKNVEGVLIQEQIKTKEFLIGLKNTKDFGFVVVFGKGGRNVEKEKKVDFRVCGVKGVEKLSNNKNIQEVIKKLCKLSEKYPNLKELDINPLILDKKGKAVIVDAQIFFE